MKNILYQKNVLTANAPGGPAQVVVTEEANCAAVWLDSDHDTLLLYYSRNRHAAIEVGVRAGELGYEGLLQVGGAVKKLLTK